MVRKQLGELGKVSEEGERSSKEETAARCRHTDQHYVSKLTTQTTASEAVIKALFQPSVCLSCVFLKA